MPLEEVELFLVLDVGGVVEAVLVELTKDLLNQDGAGGTERLPEFIANLESLNVKCILLHGRVFQAVECRSHYVLV